MTNPERARSVDWASMQLKLSDRCTGIDALSVTRTVAQKLTSAHSEK